ncbi:thioredoxin-like protein [Algoriphagus ratkowskyi]|uniref:Thioredoxin-like protein n=1 Tax=Algoriphagus ratkowskyi TaxID=57028 RepID=A0A2W7RG06_9BACT|nr:thioredoxin family protein [Algoriphagus ratkowskyi]PZX59354.1 thioredoxin-like protein [Algoriphagus ratkowskyi]TXD77380.1 hypothetical protein ESW18_11270 [Algoriphagus ratkowskyi]
MKKVLLICLLGYLCLPISTLTAQVAESPPETDLVDNSGLTGQEGESSSASEGTESVLIYVELAKKGKLDTLTFETFPFHVSTLHPNYRQKEEFVVGRRGSFFEGINPAVDQLFLFESVDFERAGYISIKRGEEPILENYLVFPGDSIKVQINEAGNRISFAGPDGDLFAVQYQMALAAEQRRFSLPSQMMTDDPEEFLNRDDYRERYRTAKTNFGGHMELVGFGEEEKVRILELWEMNLEELPEWNVLDSFRSRISSEAFDLLRADLIGKYRAGLLRKFRTEMYDRAVITRDSLFVAELNDLFASEFLLPDPGLSDQAKNLSSGWLSYKYEQAYLKALTSNSSFTKGVMADFDGELRGKIYLKFLMDKFQQIPTKTAFIERIAAFMATADQVGQLEEYSSKYISGVPVADFQFTDSMGRMYSKADFTDQVLVFYFWSTGCGASENFYKETFDQLAQEYQGSDRVELVAVNASATEEIWEKGLKSGNYTSEKLLNLYLGAEAAQWKSQYNIHLFPQLMMLDGKGSNVEILYLGQSTESIRSQIEAALSATQQSNLSLKN